MTDEPDNIILRHLRRMEEKIDIVVFDVRELKDRVGLLEQQYASVSSRIDRVESRLERIEHRLALIEMRRSTRLNVRRSLACRNSETRD
jgi:chromosome segregation ATPase